MLTQDCVICRHEDREEIDEDLLASKGRGRIASEYGVPVDAVHYHARNHLPQVLAAMPKGTVHNSPILEGLSNEALQERLRMINEIEELQLGMSDYDLKRISAQVEAME